MTCFAFHRKLEYVFPIKEPPEWANQIDRWYQLDAFAYGLPEAYFSLKRLNETPPDLILLASAASSNETDFHFAQSGANSPSKFVHTLPNIRGSTLCQLMHWKGPLLCIQHDPTTQITALSEAIDLISASRKKIWIWSVTGNYCVHWFEIQANPETVPSSDFPLAGECAYFEIERDMSTTASNAKQVTDTTFQHWLSSETSRALLLPGAFKIKRLT